MIRVHIVNPFRDFSRSFATARAAFTYANRMRAAGYIVAGIGYAGAAS